MLVFNKISFKAEVKIEGKKPKEIAELQWWEYKNQLIE